MVNKNVPVNFTLRVNFQRLYVLD